MKRYSFRLESVLRIRRLQETQAKAALQTANHHLHLAQVEVEARLNRYNDYKAYGGVMTPDEFANAQYLWDQAARAVDIAREQVVIATDHVNEAREVLIVAAKSVEVLERLDTRRREEYAIEFERAELAEVDDIVVGRHGRDFAGRAS